MLAAILAEVSYFSRVLKILGYNSIFARLKKRQTQKTPTSKNANLKKRQTQKSPNSKNAKNKKRQIMENANDSKF